MLDVSYSRFDSRLYGLGLHRGVIFESLLEACDKHQDQISQIFGLDIHEIEQQSNHATLRDGTGRAHGPYDLVRLLYISVFICNMMCINKHAFVTCVQVVMANGSHSKLRSSLKIPGFYYRYAYGALFALLPDPQETFGNQLVQRHDGPGCHTTLGFLPTGKAWGSNTFNATLYYNMRQDEWLDGAVFDQSANGFQAWKDSCCKLMPEASHLIQNVTRDQISFASYGDGGLWKFNQGRVVLIGDCSHR